MSKGWLLLFRRGDTWKPSCIVFDTEEEACEAAENYSYSGETVLVQEVTVVEGRSNSGVRSRII